jgi:hypothetical protein
MVFAEPEFNEQTQNGFYPAIKCISTKKAWFGK